jgi:hypothetical protein
VYDQQAIRPETATAIAAITSAPAPGGGRRLGRARRHQRVWPDSGRAFHRSESVLPRHPDPALPDTGVTRGAGGKAGSAPVACIRASIHNALVSLLSLISGTWSSLFVGCGRVVCVPFVIRPDYRQPQCIDLPTRALAAFACRSPQIVRTRLSAPALALATMPWKYPPGDVRKCPAGLAETSATATAAHSRPIARQASPQSGREIPISPRSQLAASRCRATPGVGWSGRFAAAAPVAAARRWSAASACRCRCVPAPPGRLWRPLPWCFLARLPCPIRLRCSLGQRLSLQRCNSRHVC